MSHLPAAAVNRRLTVVRVASSRLWSGCLAFTAYAAMAVRPVAAPCPMHEVHAAPAVPVAATSPAASAHSAHDRHGMRAMGAHVAPATPRSGDADDPPGQAPAHGCDCLRTCCASPAAIRATALPAAVVVEAPATRATWHVAPFTPTRAPHLLPYAIAPPAPGMA